MNIQQFDQRHKKEGGIDTLTRMMTLQYSTAFIAKHYGVTASSVRIWPYTLFGRKLDPTDKDNIRDNMIHYAKEHSIGEFRFAFKGGLYYKELLELVKREIYGK